MMVRTFVFAMIAMASTALAQQHPVLRGAVHDPLGALVPGASVDLLQGDRTVASVKSGPDGMFVFDLPASGRYRVRVNALSFATTVTPIDVSGSGAAALNVTLATQTLTQQITVTATGTPMPEAQTGASITVIPSADYQYMPEVQDPLRLVPGLQVTQTGQMGGTTGLSIRGGGTDANKVLIDGVPANTIGGGVEFANLATLGIDSIEVLREPNSAIYGSDALAGVVSLASPRGTTPFPLLTYSGDAGNFHTYRDEVTAGIALHRLDAYSAFARMDSSNNLPNSEFHNATYAGNFGWKLNTTNDLRFTVRHIAISGGQPNSLVFFGIPDDSVQLEHDNYYGATWNSQTTSNWHNQIRYGGLRQNGSFNSGPGTGIPDGFGDFDGSAVTITGANGYSVSGQALFQFPPRPSQFLTPASRDFVYAQTDYRVGNHFLVLGGFKYENEAGSSGNAGSSPEAIQRGNYSYTIQLSGDMRNRLFYSLGTGLEDNGLFGFAGTPRASLAYYLVRPSGSRLFSGTKLYGSFGKGIKEPSIFQQTNSLYGGLPAGSPLIAQYNIHPLGPENSRTFDGGVEQQLLSGRARAGVTYFHNQFTNGAQNVPQADLGQFGVPPALAADFPFGAYLNGAAFRALGLEIEAEYQINTHLSARTGYTYTDAVVQQSVATPAEFTSFPSIPIGAYAPLVGARPFRVAPNTGYFGLNYASRKYLLSFTGTIVGKRDDSDFLTDSNFGNGLLLPNRNLLGSYQRLELGGGYQLAPHINIYANLQNLLSEHYYEAFGFPSLPLTFRTGIKISFGGENWGFN
jgi:iron complex outermembrane receptor protein/vitamin B12 transporter